MFFEDFIVLYSAYIRRVYTDRSFPINRFQRSCESRKKKLKTTSTKIASLGAAVGIVAALLALSGALTPVFAATPQATSAATTSSVSTANIPGLTVGQTITITSTSGHFYVVGDKSETGPASGTVTLTVTGKFAGGYSLSITTGSLGVNGTTYAIASGSAEMGPYAHHLVGQGTTTPVTTTPGTTASGSFLMKATARGSFAGEYATATLDLQTGATEYIISLIGTVQG